MELFKHGGYVIVVSAVLCGKYTVISVSDLIGRIASRLVGVVGVGDGGCWRAGVGGVEVDEG